MNREIHSLLKARHAVFKSDDPGVNRKSRYDLRKAIKETKRQYRAKLETQTNHKDNLSPDTPVPSITIADVRSVFLGVNPRKEMGLDGVPDRALRSYVDQLTEVFNNIFSHYLLQTKVRTCFKKTTIIPIPKNTHAVCINDYHPVALTSIIMKCFERLVIAHINSSLPSCLNPLQIACRCNSKTIEQIIDFRKKGGEHSHIYINGAEVESIKFLGVMTTKYLSWTPQLGAMVKKAQQHLLFLRQLRRTLTNFYRCTIESILSGCITAWYGNYFAQDRKKLQRVVCIAQTIMEANLPSMNSVYTSCCRENAANIIKDPSY
eukprot:g35598.t1